MTFMIKKLVQLGSLAVVLALSSAAAKDYSRNDVLNAVTNAADYSVNVLIGPDGRGRIEYDMVSGTWNDYEVHWHTAQTLYGLLAAYELTGEETYLETAVRAGDWWISTEYEPPHPFAGLVAAAHGDKLGPLINMTTITDGTNAIFELSRVTGERKYADTATRSGEWLLENAYIPEEGLFYNIFDPRDGTVWTTKSPHHPHIGSDDIKVTHVARPNSEGYLYADMCRHTEDQRHCDVFLHVADKKIERQYDNGLWMDFEPNDPDTGRVHPRFNIWLAEAQVEAYKLTGERKYLESAAATARAMARFQQNDGAIFYHNFVEGRPDRRDITGSAVAFSGILWLKLKAHGYDEFDKNIERSVSWLLKNQFAMDHADPNLRGAFVNTRTKRKDGKVAILQRDIGASFGLRFLADYLNAKEKGE